MSSGNEELEAYRGICKCLITRIIEAASVRELLSDDILKQTRKEIPNFVENLLMTHKQNNERFENMTVNPVPITQLHHLETQISTSNMTELVRLAEVSRFIMEREIHNITGAIIDKCN
ncbi:hypothetical protein ATCVBr0604L_510L [Acanthocystis turfacea Chlorella virus Br0604L]|nr:hypothetical protein ATCVBr0604L_510L [Acanthocystis turfacea Chlorella virus Br0604L]AGE53562.1 hypothetical protein ATCVGM07011_517L [Acanthocystis turfacea Chlorella virus GM0701.1]